MVKKGLVLKDLKKAGVVQPGLSVRGLSWLKQAMHPDMTWKEFGQYAVFCKWICGEAPANTIFLPNLKINFGGTVNIIEEEPTHILSPLGGL